MNSLSHAILTGWFLPQVSVLPDIAGAVVEPFVDPAQLPKPTEGHGRAGYPFAWIEIAGDPDVELREINGSIVEAWPVSVTVAYRTATTGRDSDYEAKGDALITAVHRSILYPVRYDRAALPQGVMGADLERFETSPTAAKNIAAARLNYRVLQRRSYYDVAETHAG